MTDEQKEVKDLTNQDMINILEELSDAFSKSLKEIYETLDERIEAQEKIVASMTKTYLEIDSTMQAIIQELMSPRDEEGKEAFRKSLEEHHKRNTRLLRGLINESDPSSSEEAAAAVQRLVEQRKSDTD